MPTNKKQTYDESSIQVLGTIRGIQRRPGVYIGSAGSAGLLHLATEVFTNAIDEFLANRNDWVGVETDGVIVSVADNGPGIPVGDVKDQETGKTVSSLTAIMTKAHAGGKLDSKAYGGTSGGLNGIGLTAVNALSVHLEVYSFRSNAWNKQTFSLGAPTSKVVKCKAPSFDGKKLKKGTLVRYTPEPKFFEKGAKLSLASLKQRLSQAAYINGGIKIELKTPKNHYKFFQKEGLKSLILKIAQDKEVDIVGKALSFNIGGLEDVDTKNVNCAFCWVKDTDHTIESYVNSIRTIDGGTHVNGLYSALTEAFKPYRGKRSKFKLEDLLSGMIVAVNVSVDQPEYTSQTKDKLSKTKIAKEVQEIASRQLADLFSKNKGMIKEIVKKADEIYKLREEFAKNKKALAGVSSTKAKLKLPEKLSDCSSKDRAKCEIFFCEGESAAGSALGARDSDYQAVLELKGKILNAYTAKPDKIFSNAEIQSILVSLGYTDDPKKPLRYGKIVLLMDADEDGKHIQVLSSSTMKKLIPRAFSENMVHTIEAALYNAQVGDKVYYADSMAELKKKLGNKKVPINRVKGWGGIEHEKLEEIAFNPKTRNLTCIKDITGKNEQDYIKLVGDDPIYRKNLLGIKVTTAITEDAE